MAGNSDFEWHDWSDNNAHDTSADQANGLDMQGAIGL